MTCKVYINVFLGPQKATINVVIIHPIYTSISSILTGVLLCCLLEDINLIFAYNTHSVV